MSEIKFKRDTGFRKQFFVPDSFAHPAKMDAQLLIWIVGRYTRVGEVILDPMAGSGTLMLACGLGRNCILGELEEKFCKMMRDNWAEVKMRPQLGYQMGECQIIQGDARQLEGLLVDKCIFSPPYASPWGVSDENRPRATLEREARHKERHPDKYRPPLVSYSDSMDNIGNLPYGQIDKIVTSPPHGDSLNEKKNTTSNLRREERLRTAGHNPKEFMGGVGRNASIEDGMRYSSSPDNLGNLPYGNIDSIITSPPFSEQKTGGEQGAGKYSGTDLSQGLNRVKDDYSSLESQDNIGNLKSESYLAAMLQVYQQCHKVLKPAGLMILVTKNFIRNKQVVRLDGDTIKLCEQAGFGFVERHYRKLPAQSFWRIIYHQKHPEVEQINYEDVLVFSK